MESNPQPRSRCSNLKWTSSVKVNSLEQQLGRSQEQEKHLRRQLSQSELRLQTEQQKNRALKGE